MSSIWWDARRAGSPEGRRRTTDRLTGEGWAGSRPGGGGGGRPPRGGGAGPPPRPRARARAPPPPPPHAALLGQLGLQPGDVVTAVNGLPVDSLARGQDIMAGLASARSVRVTVQRGGKPTDLTIALP